MESVNEALKMIVKDCLEDLDIEEIVSRAVKDIIRYEYNKTVKEIVDKKVKEIVNNEIQVLLTRPIEINDGYKPSQRYVHFEHFFKEQLREVLKSSDYRIKENIMQMCKREIEKLYESHVHELKNAFVKQVTEILNIPAKV